jgi:predicted transcriptional regulator
MKTLFEFEEFIETNDRTNRAIHELLKNGGLTRNEISKNLGIRTDTIGFRLGDLRRMGMVVDGGKRICTVTGGNCKTYESNTL